MHLLKWTFPDGPDGGLKIELERYSQESKYAILSHRWGKAEDEITFQDMLSGSDLVRAKVGYEKLEGCCRQAHQDGHERVWDDTCCIDKSSSAELSEAITSMYSYYENSQVCYAFLDDIKRDAKPPIEDENARDKIPLVSKSAWFERGWTLQELIAPATVKFFDSSWVFLGMKTDDHISADIERKSGIHRNILERPQMVRAVSISNRMSWAAQRKTTRVEDRAYSLMGIFGVYMSPIYGEGHNAFIRLQEEIMRTSNDHTLFAWTLPPPKDISQRRTFEHVSTMLALSPDQFKESSRFMQRPYNSFSKRFDADKTRLHYITTNSGLSIDLPIAQIDKREGLFAAILACTEGESLVPSAILLHTTAGTPRGYFWRADTDSGPVERSGKLWFQAANRDTLTMTNVYILPKLTSVSQDYIEPHWAPLEYQVPGSIATLGLPAPDQMPISVSSFEMKRTLVQVEDPCFGELQDLKEARHMIYGRAAQFYKEQFQRYRRFPKDFPWQSRTQFFGRSAELQRIRELFEDADSTMLLVTGMWKVGKTEFAREFAYRCRDGTLFSSIIWIDASTPSTIQKGFQQVAKDIGLDHTEDNKTSEVSYKVLQWFDGLGRFLFYTSGGSVSVRWLLIFDGAEDSHDVDHIWKPHIDAGIGRILVTSRKPLPDKEWYVERIILGPLDDGEVNYMVQSLTNTNDDLGQFVACWHDTSLLAQIPSLVPWQHLLDHFDAQTASRMSYIRNGDALSEFLNSQLDALQPSAFALLSVISFFDAGLALRSAFFCWRDSSSPLDTYPRDSRAAHKIMEFLIESSLVLQLSQARQGDSVRLLPLVQKEVQDRLSKKPDIFTGALVTAIWMLGKEWIARGTEIYQRKREWILENLSPQLLRFEKLAEKVPKSIGNWSIKPQETLAWLVQSRKDLENGGVIDRRTLPDMLE
ncbi:hypothetical protein E8E14_007192 [Neopestalotiopsis sp. 37M]|nr:hypothetical protein E8E14_007192 [Neopestalotiopsis sp. 37M]